jgi:PAP2 superfamily
VTTPSQTVVFPAAVKKHALEIPYRSMQAACVTVILFVVAAFFRLGASPYIAFAFAGAFVVHMAMRPSRRELAVVAACAAMFGTAYYLLHADVANFYGAAMGISGGFLGLGSLLLVTLQWFWAPETAKRIQLERAREVVLIPALCLCSAVAVNLAIGLTPITYDRILYVFDLKFLNEPGGPPSWVIGRLFRSHPWLLKACGYVYNSLPLGLAACLAIQWRERQRNADDTRSQVDLRWISVALGVVGFLLYQVSPAAGPIYLFGKDFPFHVPDLAGLAIQPAWLQPAARNGMPSLHVGWTLLLFWNIRRRSWWMGVIAATYLTLTALATLGFGEHYLADLMVAPALALAVQAACTRTNARFRWLAMATGATITLAWLIAFRTGAALRIPEGAATWSLALVSIALPAIAGWRLEQAKNQ